MSDTFSTTETGPKEPQKLSVQLERSPDCVRLVNSKRQWGVAGFLLVWLCGWTIGCVVLLGAVITNFSFFMLLFAVPFWAAEFFVASLVGTMIASREEFVLNGDGARYRWTVFGFPTRRRHTPLGEITRFSGRNKLAIRGKSNSPSTTMSSQHEILMHTVNGDYKLPGGENQEERYWIHHVLESKLTDLRRLAPQSTASEAASSAPLPEPEQLPDVLELRPPSSTQVPAPSDTSWRLYSDFDVLRFTERGRLVLSALGMLLFINCFWNGIVGVFVGLLLGFSPDGKEQGPKGSEWWFLFLFLIPFELVGLALIAGLIAALAEPVRRTSWTFARNAVRYRFSYLGIGRTWTYEISELDRLELRKDDADDDEEEDEDDDDDKDDEQTDDLSDEPQAAPTKPRRRKPLPTPDDDSDSNVSVPADKTVTYFTLALVDRQGNAVCQWKKLSLGEACWVADTILRERAGWFG